MAELTAKQALFVAEYLIDLSASHAAQRAGYSKKTSRQLGYRLLGDPRVQAAIQAAKQAREVRTQISQDRVLQELARVAFFDPRRLLMPDGSLRPLSELDDDTAAAVAGLDIVEEFEGRGESRERVGFTKKVKVAGKVEALALAMRHLGMLRDRVELTGQNGGPIQTESAHDISDADLAAIAAGRRG